MLKHYILENKQIKEVSFLEWGKWFENFKNRIIKRDKINGVLISTIFLGLPQGFCREGDPFLFETMIFWNNGNSDHYCERYSSYEEALEGHKKAKQSVIDKIGDD